MSSKNKPGGVYAPVVTPFSADLSPDPNRFSAHCRWLIGQGVGLAIFGTNSEANSQSVDERIALLDRLLDDGVDPEHLMPGTGCCSLSDTVRLTGHAVKAGASKVLMLPPFYYKGVSDEGLFRYFSEVVERVGEERLRVYLYHIPPVAQVGISLDLIERLLKRYPSAIAGIKDSSGDWSNTEAMIRRFSDFEVYAGSETFLLSTLAAGGSGCISATANVNPSRIRHVFDAWQTADAGRLQEEITATRGIIQKFPMIPALKAIIAAFEDDPAWRTVRPPLVEVSPEQSNDLMEHLSANGFSMPGKRSQPSAAMAK